MGEHEIPVVSIVVPCYNGAAYLHACLSSALRQSFGGIEVVLQDGRSTDGSVRIAEQLGDPRVRIYSEQDAGQSDALNRGIERARGDWIIWLNADDLLSHDAVSVLLGAAKDGVDLVYGDFAMLDASGYELRRYYLGDLSVERLLQRGCFMFSGAMLFRKSVFSRFGGLDTSLNYTMDYEWYLRVADSVVWRHVPIVTGFFRLHEASKTGSVPWRFLREAHRLRWQYAGGSWRLRRLALFADAQSLVYLATRRVWTSRIWSQIRKSKRR